VELYRHEVFQMTYIEMLLMVEQSGEATLAQDVRFLITEKHRYIRQLDAPEGCWMQDTEPGAPEKRYTRSGLEWIWKREELPETPLPLAENT
jgi:hypothetical protein